MIQFIPTESSYATDRCLEKIELTGKSEEKNLKLLEKVCSVVVAEEGNCVSQHPNVAPAAVVVRLRPSPVFIFHRQNLFGMTFTFV